MRFLQWIFVVSICASAMAAKAENKKWITNDFFVQTIHSSPRVQSFGIDRTQDCRSQLASLICIVEPDDGSHGNGEFGSLRPCQPGGEKYASIFEELYDVYPTALKKMMCSLKRIQIEKVFFGTAYGGFIKDESGQVVGGLIGVRQSILDNGLDLQTWASWKDQLNFGGANDNYQYSAALPYAETRSPYGINDFLYFVIAHEFGHIFDFTNNVNVATSCNEPQKDEPYECVMDQNSWAGLSWKTSMVAQPESDFPERRSFCFYRCNGNFMNSADAIRAYGNLYKSDFISAYAATSPWDDWADSVAYFMMDEELGTSYLTQVGYISFDIMTKLHSDGFEKKFKYLKKFFSRTDLQYPGI